MSIDPQEHEDRQETKTGKVFRPPVEIKVLDLPTDKSTFDKLLRNIRAEIEFCMEYEIEKTRHEDIDDACKFQDVIDSLADLHNALEGYLK